MLGIQGSGGSGFTVLNVGRRRIGLSGTMQGVWNRIRAASV